MKITITLSHVMIVSCHVAVFKFLEKKLIFLKKKLYFLKKKIHALTRVLYGHGVNSNLTERTKLNLFRKLGYQIEHS